MLRIQTPAALAVFLWAATLSAESACEKDPYNVLADRNCGFTKNTDGWKAEKDDVTLKAVDGVLEVTSIDGMITTVSGPCVDVVKLASYTGSVRVRVVRGDVFDCRLTAQQFTATGCRGNDMGTSLNASVTPDPEWQTASDVGFMELPGGSVQLRLECDSGPHMTVQFDDVSLSVDPDTLSDI